MDPRERADATLARARARGAFVVTPESATSPMDAASTLQIPRALVSAVDRRDDDPEATMVVPAVRPDDIPAIAQEASTQVLTPRRPLPDDNTPPRPWAPPIQPPPPPPEPVPLDGLVPTVKQPPPTNRSNLSQRLDG
jgi:hypothetical protein